MKDIKDAKGSILLAFSILLLLFTICIVMYSINWDTDKSNKMNVNTNITFDGGDDALSQELQYIIPFVTTNPVFAVTAVTFVTVPTLSRPGFASNAAMFAAYPS